MTQDEIIQMASVCGFPVTLSSKCAIVRFANEIARRALREIEDSDFSEAMAKAAKAYWNHPAYEYTEMTTADANNLWRAMFSAMMAEREVMGK